MEQPFSTSKVTVEYHDPHGLYQLIAPGLVSRLPLRHLHWQSHSGPLRSIDTLHVELVAADSNASTQASSHAQFDLAPTGASIDDGFQTAAVSGRQNSVETLSVPPSGKVPAVIPRERRHQIPGLRRTPYLKLLLVRCDDSETYKAQTRSEIREWVKQNTVQRSTGSANTGKRSTTTVAENHDAFEWMIIHVVIPNTAAYAQPRTNKAGDGSNPDLAAARSTSRWGKASSTLLERLRSDFNSSSSGGSSNSSSNTGSTGGKAPIERVAQIRIGLNDVPYELLPHIVAPAPGATGGSAESEKDAQSAWAELVDKFKVLILSSFDVRVSQYEDDIHEKDMQRRLPGWNFCTFFILKEGLARGFESVGLVEDALVIYDELNVGLDTVIKEQQAVADSPAEAHGGTLLSYTEDLKAIAIQAIANHGENDAPIDLQADSRDTDTSGGLPDRPGDIPVSSTKKPYRELILANNVSVFDFRCYIFSRQITLLLRLGNAWSTREELLSKLKEQQDSTLSNTPATSAPPKSTSDEPEKLGMLAEICRRALEFVPAVSQVMREDLLYAITQATVAALTATAMHVIDNIVASFSFSIAQQILAQTSTKALPIPPSTILASDAQELKMSIPEPKTMMHPARSSSLEVRGQATGRGPPSPNVFSGAEPNGRQQAAGPDSFETTHFLKAGLEDLAARRADLYMLSRNVLLKGGEERGWSDGWPSAPLIHEPDTEAMEDVSLDGNESSTEQTTEGVAPKKNTEGDSGVVLRHSTAGIENLLLRTALETSEGFFRLYEVLTDKALRHYTVAGHTHSVSSNLADLAVLKYHLKDYAAAASYFNETTLFFGENSWGILELSMLLMYSQCLKEMGRTEEYGWRLLKLLTKAAVVERERRVHQSSLKLRGKPVSERLDVAAIRGCLADLLDTSTKMSAPMRIPLSHVFSTAKIEDPPALGDRQDSFSITLRLDSLLVDELPVDSIKARMVQTANNGQTREFWLQAKEPTVLAPGKGKVQLYSNSMIPGIYEIDQIWITSQNLVIFHNRDSSQTLKTPSDILDQPHVVLYQRTDALDIQLRTSKDLQLDKNNFLELSLLTGWNSIASCEVRVRTATGGLRLITAEAKLVGSQHMFSKPVEGGMFRFGKVDAGTTVTVTFPFSIEQDVLELSLKVEVTYTTENGTFTFAKAPSVSTALALGVNVQDVFKHDALFSRFTVSTANASPLSIFRSEIFDSELFSARFGGIPDGLPLVFPKQPVSLLYKISRKQGVTVSGTTKRTMYIKLHYCVFQDQFDSTLRASLGDAFLGVPALHQFSKTAVACVMRHVHAALTTYDLERSALLNEISTSSIDGKDWAKEFPGLGTTEGSDSSVAIELASVIRQWQKAHPIVHIQPAEVSGDHVRTILIPVDIPSVTVVHTADIQLQGPFSSAVSADTYWTAVDDNGEAKESSQQVAVPVFCVNQLLPAALRLKWTRIWDTGGGSTGLLESGARSRSAAAQPSDKDHEFSFEVIAPTDAWMIGGRRKGNFVVPAPSKNGGVGLSSTPNCEAAIPLILIPLREGRLPYPSVEIREVVKADGQSDNLVGDATGPQQNPGDMQNGTAAHYETDYRNLGETVHVVADRQRITLSLDASGPGGGPLVLESEHQAVAGRVVV